mgnify:CR=1 FL=1
METYKMLNRITGVQECDATDDDSSNPADKQNKKDAITASLYKNFACLINH